MTNIKIVGKEHRKATKEYPCDWAEDGHVIPKGNHYVSVVYDDLNHTPKKFGYTRVCLYCWVKP
jgi:hypothetical protein